MTQQNKFEVVYACEKFSGFSFRANETYYRFEKHQLIINDEEQAKEIDEVLKTYPAIGSKVKKVDLSAAEALVNQHKAQHGGAHSGAFGSKQMEQLEPNKLQSRDATLQNMKPQVKQEITNQLDESGLQMTEATNQVESPEDNSTAVSETKTKIKL